MTENSITKSTAKGIGRFISGLIMFLILVGITFVVLGVAVFEFIHLDMEAKGALTIGIVLSIIYALLVFIIPYFRKSPTVRWFAYCALGDAIWWIYLLISGN